MKKVFVLLDKLFLQNFENDYNQVFLKHNLNKHFQTYVLNLNIEFDKLANLSKNDNLSIIEFSGENLFDYIQENTDSTSFFFMPNYIIGLPDLAIKVSKASDQIFLRKDYTYKNLDRVLSCVVDDNIREKFKKEISESTIFFDSYSVTTLYSSDLMYGTKDFYKSLCKTFTDLNKSNIVQLGNHLKFDLALNITLLRNKYYVNSV